MDYAKPLTLTYFLQAATLSSAAVLGTIIGPKGKVGRLKALGVVVTTATTDAATIVSVGTFADGDAYGTLSVPVASADAGYNDFTDLTSDDNLIAADTGLEVSTNGGCTAGAGSIVVVIDWF